MQSVHSQLEDKILSLKKGTIVFVSDFAKLGSSENVKKVLLRLEKKQLLVRLAHGIYLYPKIDKELGILYPSTESIAEAIAKRDKIRIIPTGIFALQQLGISTQIPMNVIYLTDGAPRKIKVGKRTITFKKTAPKNLAIKNKILSNVVQGLKELGKESITDEIRQRINQALEKIPVEILKEEVLNAPVWVRNEVLSLNNRNK
jgi:predicted transcriptional regulator of viral defense system